MGFTCLILNLVYLIACISDGLLFIIFATNPFKELNKFGSYFTVWTCLSMLKPGQNRKVQNFFQLHRFLNTFLQLAAEKKYSKNGAAGNFFGPSYFVTALVSKLAQIRRLVHLQAHNLWLVLFFVDYMSLNKFILFRRKLDWVNHERNPILEQNNHATCIQSNVK